MKPLIALTSLLMAFQLSHSQINLIVKLDGPLKGPYTGRLFVYTLKDTSKQFNDQVMAEEPAFYLPVKSWSSGIEVNFRTGATPSHLSIDSLKEGLYKIIAILDSNTSERGNSAPGNLYSRNEGLLTIAALGCGMGSVTLNSVFKERTFKETPLAKEVTLRSKILSSFRDKDVYMKAAVILPASYQTDSSRIYPVVFIIPGWGGTHYHGAIAGNQRTYGIGQGKDKIYVYLNPETQTPWGLHAFVNSRVNGPWGTALVNELIPYLQQQYRVATKQSQTFITGQSSGGYGAVWLALHYPKAFGACWATSPDPLDFSSFTGVDLYKDANYYTAADGSERGINRIDGVYQQTHRRAAMSEVFTGDGGQQQSFEAEFGLPDKTGRPIPLFDKRTGAINNAVVKSWQPYDLGLFVQNNWKTLQKQGVGKISVYAGANDNFLLNESATAFAKKAAALKAKVKVVIIPADHFNVRNEVLTKSI